MKYRLFVLVHSSQQREEWTKKRRRSYRAFGLVATVAVGVCRTRSTQTVLALFPLSPLRLRRPIKAELISPFSGFIQLSFSTPPSLCDTSPIAHTCAEEEINAFLLNCLCFCACFDFSAIPRDDRTRQGGEFDTRFVAVAADVFNSSVLRTPPLYFALQNTEEEFLRVTSIHLWWVGERGRSNSVFVIEG